MNSPSYPYPRSRRLVALLLIAAATIPAAAAPKPAARTPAEFTIVLIPDTQNYAQKFPATYLAQTKWIKDVAARRGIKFAIDLGDIVQTSAKETEWKVADRAHKVLDGNVPYSMLPGNHDGDKQPVLFNKYFGPDRFQGKPWYAGSISPTDNSANYCRFTAGGVQMMILSLPFDPSEKVLAWANKIVAAHAQDRVIVATHAYLSRKGRTPIGNRIWETLIRANPNIFMVVCGHIPAVAHGVSVNDAGGKVHEILCDYQGLPNGGDGWLQTMRFSPATGKIHVEAYSPLLDKHNKAPQHTYTLEAKLTAAK